MHILLGSSLLFAALVPLLLLNGQRFTNTLVSVGLALAAAGIALVGVRKAMLPLNQLRACRWIAIGSVLYALILSATLPRRYAFQTKFNETAAAIRQRQ
jgi:hypothetical protein